MCGVTGPSPRAVRSAASRTRRRPLGADAGRRQRSFICEAYAVDESAELGPHRRSDDERVRQAVTDAVGLEYGPYEVVAFESGAGVQFFRPKQGSKLGDTAETVKMPARVLTFSVVGDTASLAKAVEAVRHAHSYEEPVIMVQQVWASRADFSEDRENPNRWWNRGFDV